MELKRLLPTAANPQITELCLPKLPLSPLAEDSCYCVAILGWDHCVLTNSYPLGRPNTAHSLPLSSHHLAEKAPSCPAAKSFWGTSISISANEALPKDKLTHTHKLMVTVCWSVVCLNYYSFLNPGKTITSEKCAQQINKMHQKLQCLQLALVNRKGPILLQDNA